MLNKSAAYSVHLSQINVQAWRAVLTQPLGMFHIFKRCNSVLGLAERGAEPNIAKEVPEEGHVEKLLYFPVKILFIVC